MEKVIEANLDGLVGPTHHYGGLAPGNVASEANALTISNPRKTALQGLEKMKLLHDLGIPQFIMPPPPRPNPKHYNDEVKDLALLSVAYSASYMWRANAAIVTPASDSGERTYFTAANLITHRHRAQECSETQTLLADMFPDPAHFSHCEPLPPEPRFADEGAANHMRLAASHGEKGVHVFVYGKDTDDAVIPQPKRYPARQTKQAMQTIAAHHGLDGTHALFVQQNPEAVDAGVFHNDVIAMSNEYLLICHEKAYLNQKELIERLRKMLPQLTAIEVTEAEIPLPVAVATYLFNSQLVTLPEGSMALVAPSECEENPQTSTWIKHLIEDAANPVAKVIYVNLRESMRNGGGPACLRLRVALSERELQAANPHYRYTPALHARLAAVIEDTYRDRLTLNDLVHPSFAEEAWVVQRKIMKCFKSS